jgi:hypothetical protein
MTEPVDGGLSQYPVRECICPLRNVQIGSYDGAFSLIAFRDDIVEVFILAGFERL